MTPFDQTSPHRRHRIGATAVMDLWLMLLKPRPAHAQLALLGRLVGTCARPWRTGHRQGRTGARRLALGWAAPHFTGIVFAGCWRPGGPDWCAPHAVPALGFGIRHGAAAAVRHAARHGRGVASSRTPTPVLNASRAWPTHGLRAGLYAAALAMLHPRGLKPHLPTHLIRKHLMKNIAVIYPAPGQHRALRPTRRHRRAERGRYQRQPAQGRRPHKQPSALLDSMATVFGSPTYLGGGRPSSPSWTPRPALAHAAAQGQSWPRFTVSACPRRQAEHAAVHVHLRHAARHGLEWATPSCRNRKRRAYEACHQRLGCGPA